MAQEDLGSLVAKLVVDVADLKRGLSEGRNDLQSFKNMAQDAGSSVKKALSFVGLAVGIYEIAGALKSFALEAANVGARTETLDIAMNQVGKTYNVSKQSLKYYVDELKLAGITTQESMTAVTKALTSGIPLDQLKDLATRARDIAVVAGTNTSDALGRIIHGIISGQQEPLRALMIPIGGTEEVYKRYAATLNTTWDKLNSVQKAQAMLNEVMRLSAGFAGTAAAADASVGKQLQSMERYAQEAKNALWPLFGPIMGAAVQEMTQGWKDLKKWADANQETLREWASTGAEWLKWVVTSTKDVGQFVIANKELLKVLLELAVALKVASLLVAVASAAAGATVEVGLLAAMVARLRLLLLNPYVLLITVTLIGFYEAWNKIQQLRKEAGFTPSAGRVGDAIQEGRARDKTREGKTLDMAGREDSIEAKRRGLDDKEYQKLAQEDINRNIKNREMIRKGQAGPPLPSTLPPVSLENETPAERAARESKLATEKSMKDAPKASEKEAKAKGGGKETEDKTAKAVLNDYYLLMKQLRTLYVADATASFEVFKAGQDKKKAQLDQDLQEGLISGEQYNTAVAAMDKEALAKSLVLIEAKKQAQIKARKEGLEKIAQTPDLDPQQRLYKEQAIEAAHAVYMRQINAEIEKTKLEAEKKVTEELTKQLAIQKQFRDAVDSLKESAAWGPLQEDAARLSALNRERSRMEEDARSKGQSAMIPEIGEAYDKKAFDLKFGEQIRGMTGSITSGVSSLIDSLSAGGADLKESLNSVFKNLFTEAIKPGLKQLTQWLMDGFKEMFGSLGPGIGSAIMGVVGLIGMMLTSKSSKSFSASGVESGVTSHEAVRGVIAGETSIPIAQIGVSLQDAVAPHLGVLNQIEANTRGGGGGGGGGGGQVNVTIQGIQESIKETLDAYFREYLLTGAKG